MSNPRSSYEAAKKSQSSQVWPGCKGQGACRPCGSLHDFQYTSNGQIVHDVHCWQNHTMGCPRPKPEALHDFNRVGNCRLCGVNKRNVIAAGEEARSELADGTGLGRVEG